MQTAAGLTIAILGIVWAYVIQQGAGLHASAGQRGPALWMYLFTVVITAWCAWCAFWLIDR